MDIGAIDMRFLKFGCMTQVLIRIWLQTSFKSVNYMDRILPRVVMQWIWDDQFWIFLARPQKLDYTFFTIQTKWNAVNTINKIFFW